MEKTTTMTYCDNCGKTLTGRGRLDITTDIVNRNEGEVSFIDRRLKVRVMVQEHDDAEYLGKTRPADLCQECARKLLSEASLRVEQNERASAGVEGTEPEGWN